MAIIGDMHCLRCLGMQQTGLSARQHPTYGKRRAMPDSAVRSGSRTCFCSCLEEAAAFLDLQRDSLASRMLGREIVAEGGPMIPPCLDGEPVAADPRRA